MAISEVSLANMAYWPYLPMAMTNYGGDVQVFHMPPYQNNSLSMMLNPLAAQSWGFYQMPNPAWMTPQINYQQAVADASAMLADDLNKITSQNINTSTAKLADLKVRLANKLQDKNLKQEDKVKLEEIREKIEELEEKLKKLKESTDLKPDEAHKQSADISDAIDKLNKELAGIINPSTKTKKDEITDSNDKSDNDKTDKEIDKNNDTKKQDTIDDFTPTVKDRVDIFFDAVDGIGTKNDNMEGVLSETINDGTLVEFALRWNQVYSAKNGESMIEAFMNDADHSQAKNYLPSMINSLRNRAEDLGIFDDEFAAAYNKIQKELTNSYWWNGMDDNVICQNFDLMLQKIADKEGSRFGSKAQKAA